MRHPRQLRRGRAALRRRGVCSLSKRRRSRLSAWRDQRTDRAQVRHVGVWARNCHRTAQLTMRCACGDVFDSHRLEHTLIHVPHSPPSTKPVKFAEPRPFSDPEAAVRKLIGDYRLFRLFAGKLVARILEFATYPRITELIATSRHVRNVPFPDSCIRSNFAVEESASSRRLGPQDRFTSRFSHSSVSRRDHWTRWSPSFSAAKIGSLHRTAPGHQQRMGC